MDRVPANIFPLLIEAYAKTQDCVGIFDPQDRLIYCNKSLAAMFGTTQVLATNQTFDQLVEHCFVHNEGLIIETTNLEQWLAYAHSRRRMQDYRRFEVDLHDGRWVMMTEQVMAGGYMLLSAINITDKVVERENLSDLSDNLFKLASVDASIPIYNERHFNELAQLAWQRSQRIGNSAAILLVRLNNIGQIAQEFGCGASDSVLRAQAHSLKEQLRPYDIFGYIEHDTFALLLSDTDKIGATTIFNRLNNVCDEQTIAINDQQIAFSSKLSPPFSINQNSSIKSLIFQAKNSFL